MLRPDVPDHRGNDRGGEENDIDDKGNGRRLDHVKTRNQEPGTKSPEPEPRA